MAHISVIGTGYVGLVSGACLSDFGHHVVCVDIDQEKISRLEQGHIPIYEPGLDDIVERNHKAGRLKFTTDLASAVARTDVVFIAVGTPPADDGSADLHYVLEAAADIARSLKGYTVIVDKSTVPVGTGQTVKKTIAAVLAERFSAAPDVPSSGTAGNVPVLFDVVSNPEFLREGSAVRDFTHPDRVVLGADSKQALNVMKDVYRVLYLNETPFIETDIETAEMIKYASNAFLAMKISFANELANVCERVGANIQNVTRTMGFDGRISSKFLHAGPGYGGSCFPKDTQTLDHLARTVGAPMKLMEATIIANQRQKELMVLKIIKALQSKEQTETNEGVNLEGKRIAVLGITFKPNTDDVREAPSLTILPELIKRGASLTVCDPEGKKEGSWRFTDIADSLSWADNVYDAVAGSDATVILTEWNEFRTIDFSRYEELGAAKVLCDLRNIYNRKKMEALGFQYVGVGV